MEFHRTGKVADWDTISHQERNRWQRLAAATYGFVTPGNAISLLGLVLSIGGLILLYEGAVISGFLVLLAGRIGDVLDGYAAHYTRTKSTVGETIDAGADKTIMLIALILLLGAELLPFWLLVALGIQQMISAGLGGYARLKHMAMHPSRRGKVAALIQWITLLGAILAAAADANTMILTMTQVLLAGAIVLGYIATWDYAYFVWHALRRHSGSA